MTAEGPLRGWADTAAAFLCANLPRQEGTPARDSPLGWSHMFSTAYQIGCMALIALGEATEEDWGARPQTPPMRPKMLPRWDDVAVSVLWLAEQQNLLQWRLPDGSAPIKQSGQYTILPASPPPPADIGGAYDCHPARATAEVMRVLSALGLVSDGAWTKAAELILWRCGARASGTTVATDPRFVAAIESCTATMPADSRAHLSRLVVITETDIADDRNRWQAQLVDMAARHPERPAQAQPSEEGLRRSLAFRRGHDANWLFFRRWRLPDGWLFSLQAARALEVFHDPLATAMRRAVVERLFAGSDLANAEPFAQVSA